MQEEYAFEVYTDLIICTEVTCGRFFVALDVFMVFSKLSLFCHLFHGFCI